MKTPLGLWAVLMMACASSRSLVASAAPGRGLTVPASSVDPTARVTHALNRFAYGPSPSDRADLERVGLGAWLDGQLRPALDPAIEQRLSGFKTLQLSVAEAMKAYPRPKQVLEAQGVDLNGPDAKQQLEALSKVNPDELPRQLVIELTQAKLLRAATSKRQLEEVLVDFWFNHFNVSAEKGRTRWMVNAYEREAIRPFVFGRFRDLLGATAKHPAMLWYLDNWSSVREGFTLRRGGKRLAAEPTMAEDGEPEVKPVLGLNENYARELMELHTLGVNGGYTQADVREAARALTGWGLQIRPRQPGFGTFEFHPLAHDDGPKRVLTLELTSGLMQRDGEQLLDFLARHPATARHLALKLCQKFVSDTPPPALVERVAAEYLRTEGDLTATYRALIESPETWSPAAVGAKTRTPLEFVVAAVRAVGTLDEVQRPLASALEQLGQPLYRCAPPTGYREDSAGWISAGALVSRINFGLKLASGRIPGVLVMPPAPSASASIEKTALRVLGRPASDGTLATIKRALALPAENEVDEPLAIDEAKVLGLLLGSPEFQNQ